MTYLVIPVVVFEYSFYYVSSQKSTKNYISLFCHFMKPAKTIFLSVVMETLKLRRDGLMYDH